MTSRFRARGNWTSGVNNQFVDIKALDVFLKILPWALALEAIVRGWEIMRVTGLLLNMIPSPLRGQAGEHAFGFEFFGFTFFLAGVLLLLGLIFRRFLLITSACLIGTASYLLLSASFFAEFATGGSGTGLRGGFTFLLVAGVWAFKGFFAASKKSFWDIELEAQEQSAKVIEDD